MVGCGPLSTDAKAQPAAVFDEPWDSPAAVERGRLGGEHSTPPRRFAEHGYDDGLAVAPGGAMLVSATPRQPVNTLDVVDLRTRSGWRIVHPNPRVGLLHPAFSPDGRRLAFVVGLPSGSGEFSGVSAIWIVDLSGKVVRILSAPGRLYDRPVFSRDGARLAYARDVFELTGSGLRLRPENRSAKPQSVFEADIESGDERQLSDERYLSIRPIDYAPAQDRIAFRAGPRMVPTVPGSADLGLDDSFWSGPPQAPAPVPLEVLTLSLADGKVRAAGADWAHVPGRGPGALLRLRLDGAALLFDGAVESRDEEAWTIFAANAAAARPMASGRDRRYVQAPAVSPDGGAFGAVLTGRVQTPATFDVGGFIFGALDGKSSPARLSYAQISFRAQPVVLDAALPPTGH